MAYLTACEHAHDVALNSLDDTVVGVDLQRDDELIEQHWYTLKDAELTEGKNVPPGS